MAALFSVLVQFSTASLEKKWARCISISFRVPSRGRRRVWYQAALVLCFCIKVNAYYVCFNTEYRWLKGYGKQIPLKKVVFFLLHVSNQNKCNIWDLEWKSLMRYGVYACIVDSWLLKLSVCWTRSIFWIKSDFFDAIHKA